MLNKKGQIGDTITWVVATIVIVVVLMFFIFGSSMLASTKSVGKYKSSLISTSSFVGDDIFLKKSLESYIMIKDSTTKSKIDKDLVKKEMEKKFKLSLNETRGEMNRRYNLE
ncbi:hypothetical protein GW932_02085 [archaeon]|nr:hypothetical protein [archaeon]